MSTETTKFLHGKGYYGKLDYFNDGAVWTLGHFFLDCT